MKRLRVALETQYATGTPTGLGVYVDGLRRALERREDVEVVPLEDAHYDVWRFDRRVYWDQMRAPMLARRSLADVIHFCGGTLPIATPHPCVLTLHDLAWLKGMVAAPPHAQFYFGSVQGHLSGRADYIATDSEVMRSDIVRTLDVAPSRVVVAGVGLDESWFLLERDRIDPPFFLSVGTVETRKDLVTAVCALAKVPRFRLVCVGPLTGYAQKVTQAAETLGVAARVELRGFVDDASLHALYAQASAVIFPSRYEGFGLPPLQALAARVPAIVSDIPVHREVLGEFANYAPPGDVQAFADALAAVGTGTAGSARLEAGRMHARQFTWVAVAQRMLTVYRAAAANRR